MVSLREKHPNIEVARLHSASSGQSPVSDAAPASRGTVSAGLLVDVSLLVSPELSDEPHPANTFATKASTAVATTNRFIAIREAQTYRDPLLPEDWQGTAYDRHERSFASLWLEFLASSAADGPSSSPIEE